MNELNIFDFIPNGVSSFDLHQSLFDEALEFLVVGQER
jgi:hypothetical protein